MNAITDEQITLYVQDNIKNFHDKRLESLNKLQLNNLLYRKNPYLFKSKNINMGNDLVKALLAAHLSSQEETLFGEFLEGLAIYVAETIHEGWKSSTTGIDLEFIKCDTRYIVSIKSGPNWGNSSQIKKMIDDFKVAIKIIRQNNNKIKIIAVNGCCYGHDNNPDKGTHFKYCGQKFWEFISNDVTFYTRIIEPLGHNAKTHNHDFSKRYEAIVDKFTIDFNKKFCDESGTINWKRLVSFNSSFDKD